MFPFYFGKYNYMQVNVFDISITYRKIQHHYFILRTNSLFNESVFINLAFIIEISCKTELMLPKYQLNK